MGPFKTVRNAGRQRDLSSKSGLRGYKCGIKWEVYLTPALFSVGSGVCLTSLLNAPTSDTRFFGLKIFNDILTVLQERPDIYVSLVCVHH